MKKDYWLILDIPPSGEDFDNGMAFDYPKHLPIPRIGEKIHWVDLRTYLLIVKDIRHLIDKNGITEIRIYTEYY